MYCIQVLQLVPSPPLLEVCTWGSTSRRKLNSPWRRWFGISGRSLIKSLTISTGWMKKQERELRSERAMKFPFSTKNKFKIFFCSVYVCSQSGKTKKHFFKCLYSSIELVQRIYIFIYFFKAKNILILSNSNIYLCNCLVLLYETLYFCRDFYLI